MTTIRDVAKLAGVSPITVSRVINASGYVSQETRQRVEKAVAELEYIPNTLGNSLRSKQTHILALLVTDITNPFWTTVARGVEDAARASDYYVILCNTDESEAKQYEYVSALLRKRVDGFLLVPAHSSIGGVECILKQHVPVVIIDRDIPDAAVDVVQGDSEQAAYELTAHLIALGHRDIALLGGPQEVSTAVDRARGYQRAIRKAALDERIYWGEYSQHSGYRNASLALSSDPRPTAFFAANNFIAIGAMHAILEAGLSVPKDIALVTFDELPPAPALDPFMTVAAQPAYEMGYRATELLLERIALPERRDIRRITLPTEILIRRSSGANPKAAPVVKEDILPQW